MLVPIQTHNFFIKYGKQQQIKHLVLFPAVYTSSNVSGKWK